MTYIIYQVHFVFFLFNVPKEIKCISVKRFHSSSLQVDIVETLVCLLMMLSWENI